MPKRSSRDIYNFSFIESPVMCIYKFDFNKSDNDSDKIKYVLFREVNFSSKMVIYDQKKFSIIKVIEFIIGILLCILIDKFAKDLLYLRRICLFIGSS